MQKTPPHFLLMVIVATCLAPSAGCGNCDGGFRLMRSQGAEFHPTWPQKPKLSAKQPVAIEPTDSFRIRADGPNRPGQELLQLSGVSDETWFLVEDASGGHVPSSIEADAGGHMCRNGVGFNLRPTEPLALGDYTLVLLFKKTHWVLIEGDEASQYRGQPAIVRHYRVVPPKGEASSRLRDRQQLALP